MSQKRRVQSYLLDRPLRIPQHPFGSQADGVGAKAVAMVDPKLTVMLEHRAVQVKGPRELVIGRGGFAFNVALSVDGPTVAFDDLRIDITGLHLSPDSASACVPVMRASPTVPFTGKGARPVRIEVR